MVALPVCLHRGVSTCQEGTRPICRRGGVSVSKMVGRPVCRRHQGVSICQKGTHLICRHQGVSVSQLVARRQVKMHIRKIRDREYYKLQALVPSLAYKDRVTKVEVIEEAVRYIDQLHAAILLKFSQQHGDKMAESKVQDTVQKFVIQMLNHISPADVQRHPVHIPAADSSCS